MTATTELVVPRSIPMILLMLLRSPYEDRYVSVRFLSVLLHYAILVCCCQVLSSAANCELLIAAASDLATLETPLKSGSERLTNCDVRFTFGSSGSLSQQIRNGAPYDV